jgi:hypothetical protein
MLDLSCPHALRPSRTVPPGAAGALLVRLPALHAPYYRAPPCASPGHDHGPYGALPLGSPGDVALLGSVCPAARPTTTLWYSTYGYYGTVWISSVLNGIKGEVSLDTPSQLVHTIIDHVAMVGWGRGAMRGAWCRAGVSMDRAGRPACRVACVVSALCCDERSVVVRGECLPGRTAGAWPTAPRPVVL